MMRAYGWCHNGYHDLPAAEVIRRARRARLDALIIKYGDPEFEREIMAAGIGWGSERFAYASDAAGEGRRLADAVDAGAAFAVANCEPNDGGGWEGPDAAPAVRKLIDVFRARHTTVPLYICADLRRGRSFDAPFVVEASRGGIDGWMPMVYPGAFGQGVQAAFDAVYPGPRYRDLPCEPVIQTFDVGTDIVKAEIAEALRRGAPGFSMYAVETASEDQLDAMAAARTGAPGAADLIELALAYRLGAIAALDHGDAARLAAWAGRWCGADGTAPRTGVRLLDEQRRLTYLRGALAILDHGTPKELLSWATAFCAGGELAR